MNTHHRYISARRLTLLTSTEIRALLRMPAARPLLDRDIEETTAALDLAVLAARGVE